MSATVQYLWTGTPTPDGVVVSAKMNSGSTADSARLVVSLVIGLTSPIYSAAVVPDVTYRIAKFTMTGLAANTDYYYGVEVDGVVDMATIGRFRTLPAVGSYAGFRFAFGSCTDGGSNSSFTAINALGTRPLFTLMVGDFHYADIFDANPSPTEAEYQAAYDAVFASAARHTFHREMPSPVMWDDHDFGGDNISGRNSSGVDRNCRAPAITSFRRRAPVTPAFATSTVAPYYSFIVGRVRFVVSDLRADRISTGAVEGPSKTMMGATQKQWWKDELTAAKAANQVVAWVSSTPYLAATSSGADHWGGYITERAELADHIKSSNMQNQLFVLSGDMHALAYGASADYATGGGASVPVFQGAPFSKAASTKGGPYTLGPYPASGSAVTQAYALMDVTDDGLTITVSFNGYTADGTLRVSATKAFTPFTPRFDATGGVKTIPGDGYVYWTFTASGTLNVTQSGVAEYVVVGGGGSGRRSGSSKAGGGAGGGVVIGAANFSVGPQAVTIGNGGLAATGANTGENGSSSYLGSIRAYGGGRGGSATTAPLTGASGGGGGASTTVATTGATTSPVSNQGYAGGAANFNATTALAAAGGGGGAGGVGQAGNNATGKGGDGGPGLRWPTLTGAYYGGGGGGSGGTTQGAGGIGGGTAGTLGADAADAAANTGGGGGGEGDSSSFTAGDGGSGIVIIRAPHRRKARSSGWLQ